MATTSWLLARFGEMGSFGGLAPFSCAREGHENRAAPGGKFLYFPRGGARGLHVTKSGQEPNGMKLVESYFLIDS